MKRQRVLSCANIQFKRLLRQPSLFFVLLLLPIGLTLFFKLAFGSVVDPISGETVFHLVLPGLFAYSGLLIIFFVATSFSEAREQGLLKRINTTPVTPSEFIGGNIITNMVISMIQIAIIAIVLLIMGVQTNANVAGIALTCLIIFIYSACSIGIGLIVATVAKNAQAAAGLSWLFIVPQQLFATGWIPLNDTIRVIGMFMPGYYVSDALLLIFNGTALTNLNIWFDLIVITITSVVIIIFGIHLFKKYGEA